jgi:hypothetical protein
VVALGSEFAGGTEPIYVSRSATPMHVGVYELP